MASPRTRPFALTLQAQRLEADRVWLALLALAVVFALAWAGWAFGDSVPVYAESEAVRVASGSIASTRVDDRGGAAQVGLGHAQVLEVRFPTSTRAEQLVDRPATVFVRRGALVEGIDGEITEVETDVDSGVVALVRVDHLDDVTPERVRVEVGRTSPARLWFPELLERGR